MFADTLSRCIESWEREGIKLGLPVAEDVIRQTWSDLGQRVSRDVVALYSTLGGFAEYEFDEELFWSLWPWKFLQEWNKDERRTGIMFCDHSIQVCTWELRCEDEDVSSVWLIEHDKRTAPSLESFFEMYLDDPCKLL